MFVLTRILVMHIHSATPVLFLLVSASLCQTIYWAARYLKKNLIEIFRFSQIRIAYDKTTLYNDWGDFSSVQHSLYRALWCQIKWKNKLLSFWCGKIVRHPQQRTRFWSTSSSFFLCSFLFGHQNIICITVPFPHRPSSVSFCPDYKTYMKSICCC